MARLWGSSEGLSLEIVGRNAFTTQAPGCPVWFCPAFGPVAGNLLACPVGPSESSCNCEVAAPLKHPILSFSFPKWTPRLDRESAFLNLMCVGEKSTRLFLDATTIPFLITFFP